MKQGLNCQLFIEPLGDVAYANRVICGFLEYPDVRVTNKIGDKNGETHDVWECTLPEAEKLLGSQATLKVSFAVWKSVDRDPVEFVSSIKASFRKSKIRKKGRRRKVAKPHPRPITNDTLTLSLEF